MNKTDGRMKLSLLIPPFSKSLEFKFNRSESGRGCPVIWARMTWLPFSVATTRLGLFLDWFMSANGNWKITTSPFLYFTNPSMLRPLRGCPTLLIGLLRLLMYTLKFRWFLLGLVVLRRRGLLRSGFGICRFLLVCLVFLLVLGSF